MNLSDLNNLRLISAEINDYREALMKEHDPKIHQEFQRLIDKRQSEMMDVKMDALNLIAGIDDVQTKRIIFLRFIKGLSWEQVAIKIGGGNTADGVRKRATRYIQRLSDMSAKKEVN